MNKLKIFLLTVLLSYAGLLAAAPPASSEDKGLPRYLESEFAVIKEMLELNAQKMDALSKQLDGVKTELKNEIFFAKQEINDRLDILTTDVGLVLTSLNEPDKDIQLTTEVCFDLAASWDWVLSSKASLGVGWDNVIKIDAFAELSAPGPFPVPSIYPPLGITAIPVIPAVSAGVGGTLCVNVPLYSVASNDYWSPKFDTEEFDNLIASIATPAQGLLPGVAHIYGKVMPDVTPAVDFLDDGLNLIIRDEGVSDKEALIAAANSFDKLMKSPLLSQMVDSSSQTSVLAMIDPFCLTCWVLPR
jgi:hypothetical protein